MAFMIVEVESERRNKEIWTQDVVKEYKENLQRLIWDQDVPSNIDYILWQCKQNQKIAKARLEAKKIKRIGGPPLPSFPPLKQLRCFHGYEAPMIGVSTSATRAPSVTICSPTVPFPSLHCHLPCMHVATPFSRPWVLMAGPFSQF